MRRGTRYLAAAFLAVALVTTGLGALTYRVTNELHDALQRVIHAHQVVRNINRLRVAVLDHETGTRGFALTGEAAFLAPEAAAVTALPVELASLRTLTADDAAHQQRVAQLEPLLRAQQAFDDRIIAARRTQGLDAAAALVADGDGKRVMARIGQLLTEMRDDEGRLIEVRSAAAAADGRRASGVIAFLIGASLATIGFGYWTVHRVLSEREQAVQRLDAARADAERVVNGIVEPLLVLDDDLRLVSANRAYHHLFATTPEHCTGRRLSEMITGAPQLDALRGRLADVLARDSVVHGVEILADIPGHGVRSLLVSARRLDESDDKRVLLAIEDVTDRQRVVQLEIESRALERTNRELQEFAYVASHDLQEPLRKMRAFAERLTTRFGAELGEEPRDYLARIARAAERMQRLIDDLLAFSRVTTKARPFADVDLAALAAEVLSDLEPRLQAAGGRIDVGPLPTIEADPTQMRQLLQNLLVNAVKFHRPDAAPQVRLSAAVAGEECVLSVADDGIGFDEKYLDRIFTIFQRLHGRSEFEGTGLGLAICRKIVERHHGHITAHSAPGAGATFVATLPLRQRRLQEAA